MNEATMAAIVLQVLPQLIKAFMEVKNGNFDFDVFASALLQGKKPRIKITIEVCLDEK